jgi:hypothetical protein
LNTDGLRESEGAMSEANPTAEPPYSIEATGKILLMNIHSEEAARRQVGPLARQHPGTRVQVLDHYGTVVAEAFDDQEDGA